MIYKSGYGKDNDKVLLELSIEQLITLDHILNFIGGDPKTTRRGYIDSIVDDINSFICESYYDGDLEEFTFPFIELSDGEDIKCINNQSHVGLYFQEIKNNV